MFTISLHIYPGAIPSARVRDAKYAIFGCLHRRSRRAVTPRAERYFSRFLLFVPADDEGGFCRRGWVLSAQVGAVGAVGAARRGAVRGWRGWVRSARGGAGGAGGAGERRKTARVIPRRLTVGSPPVFHSPRPFRRMIPAALIPSDRSCRIIAALKNPAAFQPPYYTSPPGTASKYSSALLPVSVAVFVRSSPAFMSSAPEYTSPLSRFLYIISGTSPRSLIMV